MNLQNIIDNTKLVLNRDVTYLIYNVTAHCNAKCDHCFYWHNIEKAKFRKSLKLPEIEKFSKSLGKMLLLNLCGGEPWLRKDLPDIARIFVKNNKVKFITIPSNGSLTDLMTKGAERMLSENPDTFFRFGLSIDAIGEKHDKIREIEGLFKMIEKTAESLNNLKKKYKNFYLISNTVFSQDTEDSIRDTLNYIKKNLPFDQNQTTYVRGTPKDTRTLKVNLKKYSELQKELAATNKVERHPMSNVLNALQHISAEKIIQAENAKNPSERPYDCFGGRKLLVVDDIGDVWPCEILKDKFGNLRDHDFDINRLLEKHEAKKLVKFIKDKKCNCTWECAIQSSLLFNPREYPGLAKRSLLGN